MYPTIIQFQNSTRVHTIEGECESYFQLIDDQRSKLELGVVNKTKLIEVTTSELEFEDDTDDEQKVINQYRIGEKLGSGQYGTVYKGHSTDRLVAIKRIYKKPLNSPFSMSQVMKTMKRYETLSSDKVIMEMNVSKIRWECFVTSKLNHPNVMPLIECLDSPYSDQIWIVQPLALLGELKWSRETKFDMIDQWQAFCQDQLTSVEDFCVKVLHDISYGLNYLEEQGIIHRDVKPQNILVDSTYRCLRISDFGCSLIVPQKLPFKDSRMDSFFENELNKIVGTPLFTAPELCNFENESVHVDPKQCFKIDIWSLGITLYSILYNALPFWGETEFDTYKLVCKQELRPQPPMRFSTRKHSNSWIHELVTKHTLCKDPVNRPSAKDLIHTLETHTKKEASSMNRMLLKLHKWKKTFLTKNKSSFSPEAPYLNDELHSTTDRNSSEGATDHHQQPLNRSHRATVNLEKYVQ